MEDGHIRDANKICGVCGDRALGYNFNAVSCESCKAFFRRNALKNKDFNCPFSENCSITPVTRRFCQKCRLDKCFSIGMRKECIMSEEDKVLKRNKIEQNRAKKRPSSDLNKITKTKKESVYDMCFEDTSTSLPSAASVTSIVSETFLWESDRNVDDLNKQPSINDTSPIAAASVPSPSTPPQNCDIAGTKTLEMLKDATFGSISTFAESDQSISFSLNELPGDKHFSSQINYNKNFNNDFNEDIRFTLEPMKITNSIDLTNTVESKSQDPINISLSSPSCSKFQNPPPHCYLFSSSSSQNKEDQPICQTNVKFMKSCIDQSSSFLLPESKVEDAFMNKLIGEHPFDKPQNGLISKLVKNPHILAKIFQDPIFLEKFVSDTDMIDKLVSNPYISQILVTKTTLTDVEESKNTQENMCNVNILDEKTIDNKISKSQQRNFPMEDQNHVQNPILSNLINNQSIREKSKQSNDISENCEKSFPTDVAEDILQNVQKEPVNPNSVESILCKAIKLEYSAYSMLDHQNNRELNDAERAKLNELIVAHKALLAPLDEDISNLVGDDCKVESNPGETDSMLLGVINLTAIAIRRLIKMSKKISAFKNLCQEDQLALLKGGCTEMMMLRSAINYDPEKKIWKIPHSQDKMANIKVEVLKEAKGNLYDEHSKFVRTFDSRWRDENIILILIAIALFSPKRPRVIHKDVIKLEQNSYYYLLRRYLESIYPGCEAKSTFLKLIQKLSELQKLNEDVVGVYLNVNPSNVEPLLIEIFDLKH